MDAAAVLPRGLPARQPDPGLERPRVPGPLARRAHEAPRHQQLPRVHGPHPPGAVRVGVRARHQRRRRDDRADRAGDRDARVRGGLDRARAARAAHRPHRGGGGLGPRGPRRGRGAQQARPHRHGLRARRGAGPACCASACPTRSSRSGSSSGAEAARGRGRAVRTNTVRTTLWPLPVSPRRSSRAYGAAPPRASQRWWWASQIGSSGSRTASVMGRTVPV